MTVIEIVLKYLNDNGYDGLCSECCGCGKDDLSPCNCDDVLACSPAYKRIATQQDINNGIECDVGDIIYAEEKP